MLPSARVARAVAATASRGLRGSSEATHRLAAAQHLCSTVPLIAAPQQRCFSSQTQVLKSKPERHTRRKPATKGAKSDKSDGAATRKPPTVKDKVKTATNLQFLLSRSQEDSFTPDSKFLSQAARVLQGCQTREQLHAALPLCRIVEQAPGSIHGQAATECVRIYHRLAKHEEIIAFVDRLVKNDFFLTPHVLTSAIHACAALGRTNKGFDFYNEAVERKTIPNVAVYSALLQLCGAAGDTGRVEVVLRKMEEDGLQMTQLTYHVLMSAYANAGHVDKALQVFEKMKQEGIDVDVHTYAILMDAYAEVGDFEGTKALMTEVKKSPDLTLNLIHYNVLIKACGKVNDLTTAFQLYEEMKVHKIKPDLVTYITMMHAVFHGELGVVDTKKVKASLIGVGAMGVAFIPFINFQDYMLTTLFCGSLVGSMGLAAYMNPDGVMRALYPNSDEPKDDTVIEAFFRRLREEDHCGRSMYLWREMLKANIPPDPRVYDVLVRTCVKKRHPELGYEAVFEEKLPLTGSDGKFVLPLGTVIQFLYSLLSQRRLNMADTLFDEGLKYGAFESVFSENGQRYVYDLRLFLNVQTRSYTISKVLDRLREMSKDRDSGAKVPDVEFLVQHGYELLDKLDSDDANARALFSMDDMKRQVSGPGQYFFRLSVSGERLAKFFETTTASTSREKKL